MKRITVALIFLAFARVAPAQNKHDLMIGGGFDLLKTFISKVILRCGQEWPKSCIFTEDTVVVVNYVNVI